MPESFSGFHLDSPCWTMNGQHQRPTVDPATGAGGAICLSASMTATFAVTMCVPPSQDLASDTNSAPPCPT